MFGAPEMLLDACQTKPLVLFFYFYNKFNDLKGVVILNKK